jgi:hypothetical protein
MRAQRRVPAAFCCAVAVLGLAAAPARSDEPAPADSAAEAQAATTDATDAPSEPASWGELGAWQELGAKAFDAAVLRPLGAGATAGGFGAFLLVMPLAWYSEGFDTVWDQFVLQPVDYTFQRPLGDF